MPDPSRDAVTVLDRYLNVLDWNEQAELLHGWTVGEAIGQNSNELVPSATPWLHAERRRQLFSTGRYDGASLIIVKSGDLVAVEAVCVAIGREYLNVMRRADALTRRRLENDLRRRYWNRSSEESSEIFAISGHDISEISDTSDGGRDRQGEGFNVMSTLATPTEIGARLRETRHDRGLTLQRLAELSGKRPSLLSELERGKHFPDVRTLVPVACALDVSVDSLVTKRENGKR